MATPSSRRRVDGVEVDAAIQDERAVNLISAQVSVPGPRHPRGAVVVRINIKCRDRLHRAHGPCITFDVDAGERVAVPARRLDGAARSYESGGAIDDCGRACRDRVGSEIIRSVQRRRRRHRRPDPWGCDAGFLEPGGGLVVVGVFAPVFLVCNKVMCSNSWQ